MRPVWAERYLFGIRDNEDRVDLPFSSYLGMGRDRELIIRPLKIFSVIYPLTDGFVEKRVLRVHPEHALTEPKCPFYLQRTF
jgi:hypothetical protein